MKLFAESFKLPIGSAILVIVASVALWSSLTTGCHAQQIPDRCFIDHQNQLVFAVPKLEEGSWNRNDGSVGAIILGSTRQFGLSELAISITVGQASNIDGEAAAMERDRALYAGIYVVGPIKKSKVGEVDMLSTDITAHDQRMKTHQLFFKDKTVKIQFGCTAGDFAKYEPLVSRIKQSIRLFDKDFKKDSKKIGRKQGMSFFDRQLGIEIGNLPHFNSKQNVKLIAFSKFHGIAYNMTVMSETASKTVDAKNSFFEQDGDRPKLSNKQKVSNGVVEWMSKDLIQKHPREIASKLCARIQGSFLKSDTIICTNVVTISDRELTQKHSGTPPWENMGGCTPLSEFLADK